MFLRSALRNLRHRAALGRIPGRGRQLAAGVLLLSLSALTDAAESEIRGPDITIIAEEEKTIFEYRQNGVLRMVRIVPKRGRPYYLVPEDPSRGFYDLERADRLLPSWVIVEF